MCESTQSRRKYNGEEIEEHKKFQDEIPNAFVMSESDYRCYA